MHAKSFECKTLTSTLLYNIRKGFFLNPVVIAYITKTYICCVLNKGFFNHQGQKIKSMRRWISAEARLEQPMQI